MGEDHHDHENGGKVYEVRAPVHNRFKCEIKLRALIAEDKGKDIAKVDVEIGLCLRGA